MVDVRLYVAAVEFHILPANWFCFVLQLHPSRTVDSRVSGGLEIGACCAPNGRETDSRNGDYPS